MSRAHVRSPVDEADYLRGEETASSTHALVSAQLTLTPGDLYDDTGLPVV